MKYDLRQMRPDGKSKYSKVEQILKAELIQDMVVSELEFCSLSEETQNRIKEKVCKECKTCVVGALYEDFDGIIYSFDLKGDGFIINPCIHDFLLKYKSEIERLNYYSWAKFLEQINDEAALIRVIDKLELATPRRDNLSVYREILRREFEENSCFYCGKKLHNSIHVDHFIPWSFVKDDKAWNFVLSCPVCNEKKKDRVAPKEYLIRVEDRNKKLMLLDNEIIKNDFNNYSDDLLYRMWAYAKLSGFKELR